VPALASDQIKGGRGPNAGETHVQTDNQSDNLYDLLRRGEIAQFNQARREGAPCDLCAPTCAARTCGDRSARSRPQRRLPAAG